MASVEGDIEDAMRVAGRLAHALYDFEPDAVRAVLDTAFAPDALLRLCHPLTEGHEGMAEGGAGYWSRAIAPLASAMPDMERRPFITMAGDDEDGAHWVGHAGHYCGTFEAPFLDIPPTGHLAHLRFHEFFRIEDDRIVEVQMIWDIPSLIMQAGIWPMGPSLGVDLMTPAPATQDGLDPQTGDAQAARDHVVAMLTAMKRHPGEGGPELMELDRYWARNMNWYGPAGIGAMRGIEGFRAHHQIPFLDAMPDRGQKWGNAAHHFIAQGHYVAVTGWPNMAQTITHDGWLGIAPAGQKVTLRSLDFWRLEGEGESRRIRENWVLVDLLDMWHQIGVDVLARMRQIAGPR